MVKSISDESAYRRRDDQERKRRRRERGAERRHSFKSCEAQLPKNLKPLRVRRKFRQNFSRDLWARLRSYGIFGARRTSTSKISQILEALEWGSVAL